MKFGREDTYFIAALNFDKRRANMTDYDVYNGINNYTFSYIHVIHALKCMGFSGHAYAHAHK